MGLARLVPLIALAGGVDPEKVTFGTGAFPYNEALGVEEVY